MERRSVAFTVILVMACLLAAYFKVRVQAFPASVKDMQAAWAVGGGTVLVFLAGVLLWLRIVRNANDDEPRGTVKTGRRIEGWEFKQNVYCPGCYDNFCFPADEHTGPSPWSVPPRSA
jgi:hypothetical protein